MAGLSVTTKTRLLIQPFLLDFSFKCCHCFHTIYNSNPFSAVFMTLMLHFSQLSNTCSVHQNIVDLLLSQKNIGSLEMGICYFRCIIYFSFKSGLVQTHVHQITNMVLATASFPRNAYFCQTALFQATCSHIFLPSNRFHITDFHSAVFTQ